MTLLRYAIDEALALARSGQADLGRQLLCRGLRNAREWRDEEWGDLLTHLWLRVLRTYDARYR